MRTCATNLHGEFIAEELTGAQTLENLWAFGDRLRASYEEMRSAPRSTTTSPDRGGSQTDPA